jgi:hypothetical protein
VASALSSMANNDLRLSLCESVFNFPCFGVFSAPTELRKFSKKNTCSCSEDGKIKIYLNRCTSSHCRRLPMHGHVHLS